MTEFKKIERQRLSHRVVDEIEHAIIAGTFQVGSKLPSEQALADQFGVSRNVVREAFKILQERGLILIQSGTGARVAVPDPSTTSDALRRYLRMIGMDSSLAALYETRTILEGSNARLAAERADEQDLAALRSCLKRMKENVRSAQKWSEADLDFHLAVARASHNPFMAALLEPLVDPLRHVIAEGYPVPGAVEAGFRAHTQIYHCIERHDSEGAFQAILKHLHDSEEGVVAALVKRANRRSKPGPRLSPQSRRASVATPD